MKKLFLMFFVSLCYGIIAFLLWTGPAYAPPPGCSPIAQNLAACQGDLDACEGDLAACEAQPAAAVPQTGQTTCWDSDGNDIACAGTGQDGDIQAGVEWPDPRFKDNMDGTITDNLTGLIWLKDANCLGGTRTWQQALDFANGLEDGECDLTDSSMEGNWYLPNRNQLTSLLDLEKFLPALPAGHPFMNVMSAYWSSTTDAPFPDLAWWVGLDGGLPFFSDKKDTSRFVTAVRGGP